MTFSFDGESVQAVGFLGKDIVFELALYE